ncbi:MAG: hypothetical protein JHC96_13400 [Brevundimonas sp.]|uniref:hypothetical protein n=1 Tax=Brevundimonas sp. TaxID=1871086 RepID=UPI001A1A6ABE|nr:hypothetical protein [Brevundimonas sp.]MBJ7319787.1 hypothetical protein [Brevundimonas sp.]
MKQFWRIVGYDGLKMTYERKLPFGSLSDGEMVEILRRLQARHLTEDEIVDSSLRKNARGRRDHLEVTINKHDVDDRYALMTTNSSWYYVASVDTESKSREV